MSTHIKVTGFIYLDRAKINDRIQLILDSTPSFESLFYIGFDAIMDEKFYLHSKDSTENIKEAKFEYSDLQIFKKFKIFKLLVDLVS